MPPLQPPPSPPTLLHRLPTPARENNLALRAPITVKGCTVTVACVREILWLFHHPEVFISPHLKVHHIHPGDPPRLAGAVFSKRKPADLRWDTTRLIFFFFVNSRTEIIEQTLTFSFPSFLLSVFVLCADSLIYYHADTEHIWLGLHYATRLPLDILCFRLLRESFLRCGKTLNANDLSISTYPSSGLSTHVNASHD